MSRGRHFKNSQQLWWNKVWFVAMVALLAVTCWHTFTYGDATSAGIASFAAGFLSGMTITALAKGLY